MTTILMTNIVFAARSGTEVATLELGQALRRRGHEVVVFSPTLGPTAHEARAMGMGVTSRIDAAGFVPDVIHGSHNSVLALAMARFPGCPAVFICHDTASGFDEPILDRRIGLYVAVDAACRNRLIVDGVDPGRIVVLPNAVDLDRFAVRDGWRGRAETALLVVKNGADHVPLVERACRRAGIALEVVGPGVGRIVSDLAERCRGADIVLAHSRSAMEAVAVGAAVIVLDELGYGGWFGRDQVDLWPDTPLSNRVLSRLPTEEGLARTLMGFDAGEARATTARLRERVDLSRMVVQWEDAYLRAAENAARDGAGCGHQDNAGLVAFLSRFMPRFDQSTEQGDRDERARRREKASDLLVELLRGAEDGLCSIGFGPGSVGQLLLADGWHGPEPFGVWSAAERAGLWVPERVLARWGYSFRVECARFLPRGLPRDELLAVEVLVGSQMLARWNFSHEHPDGAEPTVLHVPAGLRPAPGQSLLLSFRIHRPCSPVEAGDSGDRRVLGLRLAALRAVPTPEPPVGAVPA